MEPGTGRGSRTGAAPPDVSAKQIVTICAECGKVITLTDRPAQSAASTVEPETLVSHGICEACARRLYGAIFNRDR
jgi:Fe2+ or Zn2+ uptake regulation protein